VPSTPRDKDATWRSTRTHCRELGWSRARLIHELQNKRVPFRTLPPGHEPEINWSDPAVADSLDVEASQVSIFDEGLAKEQFYRGQNLVIVGNGQIIFDIEGLRTEAAPERKPKPKRKPKRKPAKKVSLAAVERCFREIIAERPDDPLNEADLLTEMKKRLGAPPGRPRVRDMWKRIAPQWKRPVGHPRNNISAKNSAT
jgi:hypothetical protein